MKIFESITTVSPIREANILIKEARRYSKNLYVYKVKDRTSALQVKEAINSKLDDITNKVPLSKLIENKHYILYNKQLKIVDIMLETNTYSVDPKTGALVDKSEKILTAETPSDTDVNNDTPEYNVIGAEYDNRDPYHPENGEVVKAGKEYKSDLEADTGSASFTTKVSDENSGPDFQSMKLTKDADLPEEQDEFYVTSKKQSSGEKIKTTNGDSIPVMGTDKKKKVTKSEKQNNNDDETEESKDDENMKNKKVKESFSTLMESEMEKAELAIAARAMSDSLQSMAEKLGNMLVDDLMPITDQMKQVYSIDEAKRFGDEVSQKVQTLLDQTRETKDVIDRNVLVLTGEAQPESDMEMSKDDLGDDLESMDDEIPDLDVPEDEMEEEDPFALAQPEEREMREQFTRANYVKVMERYNQLKKKGLL